MIVISIMCRVIFSEYYFKGHIGNKCTQVCFNVRGGSRAGSLGGAQQLTAWGGVVAEISFVSRSGPIQWGGLVAEISFVSRSWRIPVGGGVVAVIFRGLQKPARFLQHIR